METLLAILGSVTIAGTFAYFIQDACSIISDNKQDEYENHLSIKREERRLKYDAISVGDEADGGLVIEVNDKTIDILYPSGDVKTYNKEDF